MCTMYIIWDTTSAKGTWSPASLLKSPEASVLIGAETEDVTEFMHAESCAASMSDYSIPPHAVEHEERLGQSQLEQAGKK